MTENRILQADSVRALCIRKNWYNAGTCEDYGKMLDYATAHNGTLEDIKWLTIDIYNHTTCENWLYEEEKDVLENIAFHIVNDCCVTFINF